MVYKMSPNIAVYAKDIEAAKLFYSETLGFNVVSEGKDGVELSAGPNTLFLMEEDSFSGIVHELFVGDLDQARDELVAKGCTVLRWRGKGQDCYLQDPFGAIFNLWEK